jgi:hypothetical protein
VCTKSDPRKPYSCPMTASNPKDESFHAPNPARIVKYSAPQMGAQGGAGQKLDGERQRGGVE